MRQSGKVPTDMTIICEGGVKVEAHSLLISAISPVLRTAISSQFKESETKTVVLDWAKAKQVEQMLSFACGGYIIDEYPGFVTELSGDDAIDLLPFADRLNIDGLGKLCESTLASLLTTDNASNIMACAEASNCRNLYEMAKTIVYDLESKSTRLSMLVKLAGEKKELEATREKEKSELEQVKSRAYKNKARLQGIDSCIMFERDKIFLEASACSTDTGEGGEYPHPITRTLIVSSYAPVGDTHHDRPLKQRKITDPLLFNNLEEAVI